MKDKVITLLLIEDDENDVKEFKSYIDKITDIKLIATTDSSDKGIELVKSYIPETIILDIELHNGQGSGLEFLENMKKHVIDFKPIIVVTTNASSKLLYDQLHANGVDLIFYKKQKDYSPELVISSLLLLTKNLYRFKKDENTVKESIFEIKTKISNRINSELDLIGISSHLKGRKYIFDAITYLLEQKEDNYNETVFNHLANVYKKSASSIGRVMQTAINYAWRTSAPEDLEALYTAKINYNTGVPTPTEFIYHYSEKIRKQL